MTGIAGETTVWLTAATTMPSMSPTKMTFLRPELPFSTTLSGLLHEPGDEPEHPSELRQLLLAELLANTFLEPLAPLLAALDQAPALLRGAQPHHPVVLGV